MKRKRGKRIVLALICIMVLSGGIFLHQYYSKYAIIVYKAKPYQSNGEAILSKELTELEVKADAEEMIEIMESTHPIFLEGETKKYREAKERFLHETSKEMTVETFRVSVSRYLSSIQDGHTRLNWKEVKYLDVNWRYLDGKLILFDENNKSTNKIVTKINEIDIYKIINTVKELFPAENYVAEALNYSIYSRGEEVLKYSGVDCTKDMVLTVMSEALEEEVQTKFRIEENTYTIDYEISNKKIDDHTIYVKLDICALNEDLNRVAEDLKRAVTAGTENVIIDVRDNPGGNSSACNALMDSLNIKPGEFGSIIRFSPLAQEQHGYLRKSGFISYERSNEAVPNQDINLYILTNEQTFSSAQWLATWVQDGKLGTIVGRPSSNMPSSFGDVLGFQLKNSKLEGQISYKKWTRPDETKDNERVLEPDIYVDYSEDPLEKVMELIRSGKTSNSGQADNGLRQKLSRNL